MKLMQINQEVLDQVQAAKAQLLVVTKYWNEVETQLIIDQLKTEDCILGWGENRTAALQAKALPREQVHFIGRLQSRQLPCVVDHCATLHSLAHLKHAQKINQLVTQKSLDPLHVFVQVNVSGDPAKEGITSDEVPEFLKSLSQFKGLTVSGFSSMGWENVETREERRKKRQEFRDLIQLRDEHLPGGVTSAGTSRDYPLALQAGIDVVRVGQGIVSD